VLPPAAARVILSGTRAWHATLAKLEALFDAEYAINRERGSRAPAMGRYAGDVYYSGGAYYFSTLAAAEFCFRAALQVTGKRLAAARGDAFLATVRAYTPADGELSEQFGSAHPGVSTICAASWLGATRRSISCASGQGRVTLAF